MALLIVKVADPWVRRSLGLSHENETRIRARLVFSAPETAAPDGRELSYGKHI